MLLSGRLSDWSVEDLLQMLHITKKTASLHVDGEERSGVVYFDEGAIVGAHVSVGMAGDGDRDAVVEAIYVLLLLDEGEFEMRNEVSPVSIEPMTVAEALELASEHVEAERSLDDTGLLGARGLRLAPEIDEPIILSEEVWAAVSVSIPAFTFAELEQRMGRAGAVDTLEQFRDLGVLEAVLDEPAVDEPGHPVEVAPEPETVHDADAVAPVAEVEVTEVEVAEVEDVPFEHIEIEDADPAPITPAHAEQDDGIVPVAEDDTWIEPRHDVAPVWMADDADVDGDEDDASAEASPASGGSLSDAIRAAAAAAPAVSAPEPSPADESSDPDDESRLLSEAASEQDGPEQVLDADVTGDEVGSNLRRSVRSLVAPSDTTLVEDVLDDLGSRFRQQSGD